MSQLARKFEKPFLVTLLLGAFLIFALVDLPPYLQGMNALKWPSVKGQLDSLDMQFFTVGRDPAWTPKVIYHYKVNNVEYTSERLSFQAPIGLPGYESGKYGEKYKAGKEVNVFYDPKNAKESFLENNPSLSTGIAHLLAYLIFVFIMYLSVYPQISNEPSNLEAAGPQPKSQNRDPEPQT